MIIENEKLMQKLGENYSKTNNLILLYGELGAGKTNFVKGFGKGLSIDKKIITSPTYTYINNYDNKLTHIDMYRIQNESELIEKGIIETILESQYVIIEWPKFEYLYEDSNWIKIYIDKIDEKTRNVKFDKIQ